MNKRKLIIDKLNTGITLIALIITIIVLLILSVVTLNMLLGKNGIINKANIAKERSNESQAREIVKVKVLNYKTDAMSKNEMPTLEGLKSYYTQDKEIESIVLCKEVASLKEIEAGEKATRAKIKLKAYKYVYILDEELNIIDQNDGSNEEEENSHKGTQIEQIEDITIGEITYKQYEIWNKEQLKNFRDRVNNREAFENCIIKQKANINLNNEEWESIGNFENPFSGIFDAEGNTIRGLNINNQKIFQGLFGHVKNGTVKNLSVEGSVTAGHASAGIIGVINGGRIEYCNSNVSVSNANNGLYVSWNDLFKNSITIGGICGAVTNTTEIIKCSNIGNIQCNVGNCDTIAAGGIVGAINEVAINSNVENCTNSGEIKVSSTTPNTGTAPILGGIVGIIYEGKISKCNNTGKIYSIETNDITTYNGAGGIAGDCHNTNNSTSKKIEMCWNKGEIENSISGGIVAFNNNYTIINCYNAGKIKSNYKCGISTSNCPMSAGICPSNAGTIQNCYNKGEVENNGCGFLPTNLNLGISAGIVSGNARGNISNCYNKGDIKSLPSSDEQRGCTSGGIVGTNSGNILNVYNRGNIIANDHELIFTGGIVSWEISDKNTRYVNYVYNIGNLMGAARGGVLGVSNAPSGKSIWSNFYFLENKGATNAVATLSTDTDPSRYTSNQIKELITNGELPSTDWSTSPNKNDGYPYLKVFDDESVWLTNNDINDGDPYLKDNLPK